MENPIEQVRKLESNELHIILFSFVGLISPGVLSIWFYDPKLIYGSSFLVLVLLSLSITTPIAVLNYVVIAVDSKKYTELVHFGFAIAVLAFATLFVVFVNLFYLLPMKYYVALALTISLLTSFALRRSAKS